MRWRGRTVACATGIACCLSLACSSSSTASASASASAASASSTASSSASTAAPRAGVFPFVIDRLSEHFRGRVVGVSYVDGYVYVDVVSDGVTRSVVALKKDIAVGAVVDVAAFGSAEGFVSKKTGRTFERLWFAVLHPEEHAS